MIDLNEALGNVMMDAYAAQFPAGSLLQIRTGAPPGAEAAAGGTLLAEITLPATPWAAAAAGSVAKQGVWSAAAVAAGVAAHFRLQNAAGTRIDEGTITGTGGGGDLILDNTNIAVGQTVTISTLTRTLP